MQLCHIFCALFIVASVVSAKKQHNEETSPYKKAIRECQRNETTKIEAKVLRKIRKNKPIELPDNYGAHTLCILKGLGYMNENNTINEEKIVKRVAKKVSDDSEEVDEIVKKCRAAQRTPEETAMHIRKCLLNYEIDIV